MGKLAKGVAGGAAWLIATGLTTSSAIWPTVLKPHPWCVFALVVVGAVFIAATLVGDKDEGRRKIQATKIGHENSGHVYTAGGNLTVNQGSNSSRAADLPIPPAPTQTQNAVTLSILDAELLQVTYGFDRVWRRDDSGQLTLVVWVHNETLGEVKNIAASIQYRTSNRTVYATRTYWLNAFRNAVSMNIGERLGVIACQLSGTKFLCYENKSGPTRRTRRISFSENNPVADHIGLGISDYLKLEVIIYAGESVADKKAFTIRSTANSIGWMVEPF